MQNKQIIKETTHQHLIVSYSIYSIIKKNTSSQDTIGLNSTFQTEVINKQLATGLKPPRHIKLYILYFKVRYNHQTTPLDNIGQNSPPVHCSILPKIKKYFNHYIQTYICERNLIIGRTSHHHLRRVPAM